MHMLRAATRHGKRCHQTSTQTILKTLVFQTPQRLQCASLDEILMHPACPAIPGCRLDLQGTTWGCWCSLCFLWLPRS